VELDYGIYSVQLDWIVFFVIESGQALQLFFYSD